MTANVIERMKFPVICFQNIFLDLVWDIDSLTTATKSGLKGNWFSNLLIVDSNLCAFKVKSAKKLHGVGLFWGYNIFLNQRIKVELQFEGEPKKISLEEVKQRILSSFKNRPGWSSMDPDFLDELKFRIERASSYDAIIEILKPLWGL
jgi:hypothetical protein